MKVSIFTATAIAAPVLLHASAAYAAPEAAMPTQAAVARGAYAQDAFPVMLGRDLGDDIQSSVSAQNAQIQSSIAAQNANLHSSLSNQFSEQSASQASAIDSITKSDSTIPFTQPTNGVCKGSFVNGQCCAGSVINNVCYDTKAKSGAVISTGNGSIISGGSDTDSSGSNSSSTTTTTGGPNGAAKHGVVELSALAMAAVPLLFCLAL